MIKSPLFILTALFLANQAFSQKLLIEISKSECALCNALVSQSAHFQIPVLVKIPDSSFIKQLPKSKWLKYEIVKSTNESIFSYYYLLGKTNRVMKWGKLKDLSNDKDELRKLIQFNKLKLAPTNNLRIQLDNINSCFLTEDGDLYEFNLDENATAVSKVTLDDAMIKNLIFTITNDTKEADAAFAKYKEYEGKRPQRQWRFTSISINGYFAYSILVLTLPTTVDFGPELGKGINHQKFFFLYKMDLKANTYVPYLIDVDKMKGYDFDEYSAFCLRENDLYISVFGYDGDKKILAKCKYKSSKYVFSNFTKNTLSKYNQDSELQYDLADILISDNWMTFGLSPEFSKLDKRKTYHTKISDIKNDFSNLANGQAKVDNWINDFKIADCSEFKILALDSNGVYMCVGNFKEKAPSMRRLSPTVNKTYPCYFYNETTAYYFNAESGQLEFLDISFYFKPTEL